MSKDGRLGQEADRATEQAGAATASPPFGSVSTDAALIENARQTWPLYPELGPITRAQRVRINALCDRLEASGELLEALETARGNLVNIAIGAVSGDTKAQLRQAADRAAERIDAAIAKARGLPLPPPPEIQS